MRKLTNDELEKFIDCFCITSKPYNSQLKEFFENQITNYGDRAAYKDVFDKWSRYLGSMSDKYEDEDDYDRWFKNLSKDTIDPADIAKYRLPEDPLDLTLVGENLTNLAIEICEIGKKFISDVKAIEDLPLNATFDFDYNYCECIIFLPTTARNISKTDIKESLAKGNRMYKKVVNEFQEAIKKCNTIQGKDGVHVKLSTSTYSELTDTDSDERADKFTDNAIWEKEAGVDYALGVFYANKNAVEEEQLKAFFELVPPIHLMAKPE